MSDFDSPWKEALDLYFPLFMAFFFPDAYAAIDWDAGYETLDKELQKISKGGKRGRRYVDKLVKVRLKNGQEQWLLLHIEVQARKDSEFPKRMFVYYYRLFDKYNEEVVSLAVLADGNPNWRPSNFRKALWGCKLDFDFPIVKLLDYASRADDLERNDNIFALIVLAHLRNLQTRRDPLARQNWKICLIRGLYDRGLDADQVRQLFRIVDWIMDLPAPQDKIFWQEIKKFEEEKVMPFITTPERIGRAEGRAEGRVEGRVEGRAEGRAETWVEAIERVLTKKFVNADEKFLAEIRMIPDAQKLEAIFDAAITVESIDELRVLISR